MENQENKFSRVIKSDAKQLLKSVSLTLKAAKPQIKCSKKLSHLTSASRKQ
jgi:hypothetical protein